MADVWSPFNVSAITIVPAAFVNLTSPGRPNAIGLQDPAWLRCFDPSRPQFDCATLKPLAPTNDQWEAFAGGLLCSSNLCPCTMNNSFEYMLHTIVCETCVVQSQPPQTSP